ncbi:MEDS domain-containing protein [Methanococcoides sp. LMO-2]|uniref:MEDS domain-containing protein n=1 Tax=Methanococcoides cohabitans TaxID=3136559 RepID=A0ABU9KRS5_9EURY
MKEYSRKIGLPISDVPHGDHITLVYKNDDNVLDFVSSFLRSGFRRNDLCVWITPGMKVKEDADNIFKEKTIYVNHNSCSTNFNLVLVNPEILSNVGLFCNSILELIEKKQKFVLKSGFNGLRINVDLIADKGQMFPFLEQCRRSIISSTSAMDLTTLFTCPLDSLSSSEVLELADDREKTIMKTNGMWMNLVDMLSSKCMKQCALSRTC